MKFFEQYFSDVDFTTGEEVRVLCPFHEDTNPSLSINTAKSVYHCLVCDAKGSEQKFISELNKISLVDATKVLSKLNEHPSNWLLVEKPDLWANNQVLNATRGLGFSDKTIEELDLGLIYDSKQRPYLGIPVFYGKTLMDSRRYNILKHNKSPKVKSQQGAEAGWVIPYDLWKNDDSTTYIFEGEKDMIMGREQGLNAITLTGGAQASPNDMIVKDFKGRDVVICYDNDDAGRKGAIRLYHALRQYTQDVHYVDIAELVNEEKEDFYDYFSKYDGDIFTFLSLELQEFADEQEQDLYVPIKQALGENRLKEHLRSKVTVNGEFADTYAVPTTVTLRKTEEGKGILYKNEEAYWYATKGNRSQMLELVEASADASSVQRKLKQFAGLSSNEEHVAVYPSNFITIYKARVTDVIDTGSNISIDLYAFDKMDVGKQYDISYTIYPHPTKHQKLIAVAESMLSLDAQENFKPNQAILEKFQKEGTVEERLDYLYQSAKHHIAKHLNYDIWLMEDLVFNSVLEYDYGKKIRGALDVFILGDTQVGKSETAEMLVENVYNFGHFLSLKTSTTTGLIGGSHKVEGSYLNTIGALPKQHRGLAVLEEFSGAKPDFIKTMTDIRSSGKIRFARVAGETEMDCRVRMITLSNPINDEYGNPRHLSTFPNGVIPLMELITSAEDVARYDGFLLVSKPKNRKNPFAYKLQGEPIPKENYQHKILWVATRKPEHVVFAEDSDSYIWERAEELNDLFECSFPLFTTTTSLKLSRFCVAMASLLMNTDEAFEKVIVTKEIVDYVVKYLKSIYDNDVFRLREYKEEYDSYIHSSKTDVHELEKLWAKNATMLGFLEHQSVTSQSNLRSISGLTGDEFNPVFNKLVSLKFLRLSKSNVYPTERFRDGMKKISRGLTIDTGEIKHSGNDKIF